MARVRQFDVYLCLECGLLFRPRPGADTSYCQRHTSPRPKAATMRFRGKAAGGVVKASVKLGSASVTLRMGGKARGRTGAGRKATPSKGPRVFYGTSRHAIVRFRSKASGRAPRPRFEVETKQEEQYGRRRRRGPSAEIEAAIYRFAQRNTMSYEMAAHLWGY